MFDKTILKSGIVCSREVNTKHRVLTAKNSFHIPRSGYVFKAVKRSKDKHLSYHAVWSALTTYAKSVDKEYPNNGFKKIKTHSGRV